MNIFSWNVNGIRAVINKGALQGFLKDYDPDILCLQEIKANEDQVDTKFEGYYMYWNSAKKKGYSGTAILSKIKPLSTASGFPDAILKKFDFENDGYGNPNEEGRVLVAEYEDFYVATVYTPNTKPDLSRLSLRSDHWDPAFLEYMKLLEKNKPVLFCGDLNVAHSEEDLENPKATIGKHGFTNEERQGFENFLNAGYIDSFRKFTPSGNGHYTWWSHFANARERNIGWRIDYWLVSKLLTDRLQEAAIYPSVLGSDHCPVSIRIK